MGTINPVSNKFRIADMNAMLERETQCEFGDTTIIALREHAKGTRGAKLTQANKILAGASIAESKPSRGSGSGSGSPKRYDWNITIKHNEGAGLSEYVASINLPTEHAQIWGADLCAGMVWNINPKAIDKGIMRIIESLYGENPRVNECDESGKILTDSWAWDKYTSNAKTLESAMLDILTQLIKDGGIARVGEVKPVRSGERKLPELTKYLKS